MKKFIVGITLISSAATHAKQEQPQQVASQNQVQTATQPKKQEDVDYGPQILAVFLTQVVPGFAKMAIGNESDNPALAADGIQQFMQGGLAFLTLATRHQKELADFLHNEQAVQDFFHEHQNDEQVQDALKTLRTFKTNSEKNN